MKIFVFPRYVRTATVACVLGAAVLAGACSVYRPEVIQGNFVAREVAAQLQPGMSREAVSQLLGTPLLKDLFRSNRWDYVFSIRHRAGVEPQQYTLTLFFDGDRLERIQGAESLPAETEFVHSISGRRTPPRPRQLQADPQQLEQFLQRHRYAPAATAPGASTSAGSH